MTPPGRGGENTNFLFCWWIFMYDSSFCSYFNQENNYARKNQQKIISIPQKGWKRQKMDISMLYVLGPNQISLCAWNHFDDQCNNLHELLSRPLSHKIGVIFLAPPEPPFSPPAKRRPPGEGVKILTFLFVDRFSCMIAHFVRILKGKTSMREKVNKN